MDEKRSLGEEIGRRSFGVMWMDEEGRLMQELDDARTPPPPAPRPQIEGVSRESAAMAESIPPAAR